ncbi:4'-phosphopantetheinyl transferase superfamily protein [uncultured Spirosoma sp.]|uniref:4'-phosphopantetheinyl transferase family protein n=1 Tax=uncultured Spirosoma sp. TaxID=278208 RepID=UPI002586DC85|nr:4'-phosphopantetheinyl transferase superfamily protein [uncultured Spirosoma sp.]
MSPNAQLLTISPDCQALLLPIVADEPDLQAGLPLTQPELNELALIRHPAQRTEWLACRVAIRQLVEQLGGVYTGLYKDEYGKPHLRGLPWSISLSHTTGWAAAVLHQSRPVGIDIEPIREQFQRVVPRTLSASEIAHAAGLPERLAVYWCAKESLYKLYGKRQLTFREHLHIDPFTDGAIQLTGYVRLPDHTETLTICCYTIGPGLLAVAY